jgi:hypothetical protein
MLLGRKLLKIPFSRAPCLRLRFSDGPEAIRDSMKREHKGGLTLFIPEHSIFEIEQLPFNPHSRTACPQADNDSHRLARGMLLSYERQSHEPDLCTSQETCFYPDHLPHSHNNLAFWGLRCTEPTS